jgi:hypothetical protein
LLHWTGSARRDASSPPGSTFDGALKPCQTCLLICQPYLGWSGQGCWSPDDSVASQSRHGDDEERSQQSFQRPDSAARSDRCPPRIPCAAVSHVCVDSNIIRETESLARPVPRVAAVHPTDRCRTTHVTSVKQEPPALGIARALDDVISLLRLSKRYEHGSVFVFRAPSFVLTAGYKLYFVLDSMKRLS